MLKKAVIDADSPDILAYIFYARHQGNHSSYYQSYIDPRFTCFVKMIDYITIGDVIQLKINKSIFSGFGIFNLIVDE